MFVVISPVTASPSAVSEQTVILYFLKKCHCPARSAIWQGLYIHIALSFGKISYLPNFRILEAGGAGKNHFTDCDGSAHLAENSSQRSDEVATLGTLPASPPPGAARLCATSQGLAGATWIYGTSKARRRMLRSGTEGRRSKAAPRSSASECRPAWAQGEGGNLAQPCKKPVYL